MNPQVSTELSGKIFQHNQIKDFSGLLGDIRELSAVLTLLVDFSGRIENSLQNLVLVLEEVQLQDRS